jgi:hypothetical protein
VRDNPSKGTGMSLFLARRRLRRAARRSLMVLVAAVAVCLAPALPAQAHDVLLRTEPSDGAVLDTPPTQVRLTFGQQALSIGTRVAVSGPSGPIAAPPVEVVGSYVTQPLPTGLPAGRYTVLWRVTSADGHPVSGRFTFSATGPGSGAVAPSSTTAEPGSSTDASAQASTGALAGAPSATTTADGSGSAGISLPLLIGVLASVAVITALAVLLALGLIRPRRAARSTPGPDITSPRR